MSFGKVFDGPIWSLMTIGMIALLVILSIAIVGYQILEEKFILWL